MSCIVLHLSSRRVFDQRILFPQRSVSDSEPPGPRVPVGKIDGSEDEPVSGHAVSWHLSRKQSMGLRARGSDK